MGTDAERALAALTERILAEARGKERLLVAIDGRCASGKTTLANALGERFGWSVVHLDDFFLRPEQRTAARLSTPGENVDHERFLAEVLIPLRAGRGAVWHPFDCGTTALSPEEKTAAPTRVILFEGAYACHPSLWEFYDLRVFVTTLRERQEARILRRNGEDGLAVFREKWIPLEEAYFAAFAIERRCDLRVET